MSATHPQEQGPAGWGKALVGFGVLAVLGLGLIFDAPKRADADAAPTPAPAPRDEGLELRRMYFPTHPLEQPMPSLDGVEAQGVDLRIGSTFVPRPVDEVYHWYLEQLDSDETVVFGQNDPQGMTYLSYVSKDTPGRPMTLTLLPDGEGTIVMSSGADTRGLLEAQPMPADLPAPPGAHGVYVVRTAATQRTLRYDVPTPPEQTTAWLMTNLAAAGWVKSTSTTMSGAGMLQVRRGAATASFMVKPDPTGAASNVLVVMMGESDGLAPVVKAGDAE